MWKNYLIYDLWICMAQGFTSAETAKFLKMSRNKVMGKAYREWGGWGRKYAPDPIFFGKKERLNRKLKFFYAVVVDNEAICIREKKKDAIALAYNILQWENPRGEKEWDKMEIYRMVKKFSEKEIKNLKLDQDYEGTRKYRFS